MRYDGSDPFSMKRERFSILSELARIEEYADMVGDDLLLFYLFCGELIVSWNACLLSPSTLANLSDGMLYPTENEAFTRFIERICRNRGNDSCICTSKYQ